MSKKQIGINMIANIFAFVVSMGINLFFTPFLIKTVGIEAYSFLPMTGNITSYFMIIATALNSMSGRFITVAIHKNDEEQARTYFSTTFFSNIVLSLFFGIVFTAIIVFLDKILQIPTSIQSDIKILFALTFLSTIITLLTTVFSVATFCKNRLDLNSLVQISTSVLRVVVLFLLFVFFKANIIYIGIASVVVVATSGIANIFFTKHLLPNLVIARKYFDRKAIKILISSGIWNSVSQSGVILLTGFDLLLANIFLSATSAGNIGIAKTIPGLIYSISSLVVTAFVPEFTILFAKEKKEELLNSIKVSLKILTLIMSIPLAGFVVLGYDFYNLWIPAQDNKLIYILTIIAMIPTFFTVFIVPLKNVYGVTNKLKKPTLFTLLLGVCNLIIVFILLKIFPQYGIYFIAGVSGILMLTDMLLFAPIYCAKCLNLKWTTFYPHIFGSSLSTAILIIMFCIIKSLFVINNWFVLFLVFALCGFVGLLFNFMLILNRTEKRSIILIVKNKIKLK